MGQQPERGVATSPDGVSVAYRVAGDGAPVVLVHGAGLSQVPWRGLGYVAGLAGFTTVTMDLRGHGLSGKPEGPGAFAIDRLAEDVVAVLDHLGIQSAHVVGYSLGARVGFELVRRHPLRVGSLVSIAGTYRAMAGLPAELFFAGYAHVIRDGGMDAFVDQWHHNTDRPIDDATGRALRGSDAGSMLAMFSALENEPAIPDSELVASRCPTLLVAGDRDHIAWEASVAANRLLCDSILLDLAGADHIDTLARRARILHFAIPFMDSQPCPDTQVARPRRAHDPTGRHGLTNARTSWR